MTSKEFEIARLTMVQAARNGNLGEAVGFAWANRVYPAFNPSPVAESFREDFETPGEMVIRVAELIEEMADQNNEEVYFYSLETALNVGRNGPMSRGQLIDCCRYIFLDQRFNEKVWASLTKPGSGPVESQSLAKAKIEAMWDLPLDA